ncbi:MAG: DMT family transporter [Anaerovibrio sp.]|uniref:DMT family transporter n=1 Tax=Anaerovibrio sp. TaxID=1872532 RepID=UPI0025FA3B06|nr:EamA family transporter [Anaerovibrio sp.]MCR5176791.1 DMT family transporter [Anaerovibrio sp.]
MIRLPAGQKGAILALTGSILWGIMGVSCQYLLQYKGVPALWLVNIRMFFAGIILLVADYMIYRKDFLAIWKGKKNIIQLLIFSFISIMWVQFTYLASVEHMNAAMATVFISLTPIVVILWVSITKHHLPRFYEIVCSASAIIGTIVMVTHGNMLSLSISEEGFLWGIILPVAGVIYTVQPGYLMKHFRPSNVVGWGLLIGGTALLPVVQPWDISQTVTIDLYSIANLVYTVIFGTALAFWTFLSSLQYIKPYIAAIYEMIEPISAILLSLMILGVLYELPEFIGTLMILCPVFYLSFRHQT